jgi:hypothetical protein
LTDLDGHGWCFQSAAAEASEKAEATEREPNQDPCRPL